MLAIEIQEESMPSKTGSAARSFKVLLEPDGTRLRWVVARLPFDPVKAWPERNRLRVKAEIGEQSFRTSLFPAAQKGVHILLVNKKMQAAAGAGVGQRIRITLTPDLEERDAELPAELAKLLRGERTLNRWFGQLSPSMQREIGKWIAEAKSAPTRLKRAEKMAERLTLAMEGEQEIPPILRVALGHTPKALAGWQMLTVNQRRNHLLGIFYYETVDGRERRAAKAVQDALRAAERHV